MNRPSDTRQRILDTARDLIHARSFMDVGVAEICERAQIRKGSFYHFFPSKQDLTLAVLDQLLAESKERILDRAFDPRIPPLERIDRFVELTFEVQKDRASLAGHVLGCPIGNLATELATQDEAIRVATAKAFKRLQARIRDTLAEAIVDLEGIDLDATTQAMVAYFEGVLMLAKTENDVQIIRRLLPALRDIRVPTKTKTEKRK